MMTFRKKFLFAFITLILIVLITLGLLLGNLLKSSYMISYNKQVQKETEFIANYIQDHGGIRYFIKHHKIDELKPLIKANVTILSDTGKILYDSNEQKIEDPKRHYKILKQVVLEQTKNSSKGYEVVDGDVKFYYYWKTIERNNKVEGFIVHSSKIEDLQLLSNQMWKILIIGLGVALVIFLMLGSSITKQYMGPIEDATITAIELAQGNYRARASDSYSVETKVLTTSLNKLARNLQEAELSREMHQDRLETLIENLGSGVIFIDNKGYIALINREYKKLFHIDPVQFMFRIYHDVIESEEIIVLIEEVFRTEKSIKRQIELPFESGSRHFEVYGAPIIGNHDEWNGILLIFHDISELKRLEHVRQDFVANVSHELKTPITSIKGFSETLLDGALYDEQTLRSFLTIILNESNRLQMLIQELLLLSKMEQQVMVLHAEEMDLVPLLSEIGMMLSTRMQAKQIAFEMDMPEHAVIEADLPRIKQVFINLISNAVNYTPNGRTVSVKVKDEEDCVTVAIQDTGIGIEKKELSRIFERFYRVDKARSRESGGTGLGLSIVKHIIEMHHGKVTVDSTVDVGTTFTVTLAKKLEESKSF